jgi:hypothetical protein
VDPEERLMPTSEPRVVCIGRTATVLGGVGILGNVLGVVFLRDVPSPYRPGDVAAWLAGAHADPTATLLSAWSFVIGLVALAAFAVLLASAARPAHPGPFLAGAAVIALGALLNAAGCVAPAVAVRFTAPPPDAVGAAVGAALLALTLHLDAAFNLALGAGLLLVNLGLGRSSGWPGWLRALGVLGGLASLPVFLQFWADGFALLLAVSGPIWLAWFAAVSVRAALGRV